MKGYRILCESTRDALESNVIEFLRRGWVLVGGVSAVYTPEYHRANVQTVVVRFYQAMAVADSLTHSDKPTAARPGGASSEAAQDYVRSEMKRFGASARLVNIIIAYDLLDLDVLLSLSRADFRKYPNAGQVTSAEFLRFKEYLLGQGRARL